MIKAYFQLTRPFNAMAGCIVVLLSGYVARTSSWLPVVLAAITVLLITASTNAWNDYIDIEIDRVNKPERPLPSGRISPHGALLFSLVGSALSLIIAVFINQTAFLIVLASNALLYLYSWKLKCMVLWGNFTVATTVALCFIYGGVAAGNIQPTLMLALTVFFAMTGREILLTMADYKGDKQQNCHTISTVWGRNVAGIFVAVFLGISAIAMFLTYIIQKYNIIYLILVVLIMYPIFIYVSFNALKNGSKQLLARSGYLMQFSYIIWFLAIALGAGLEV